jgi:murein L,D-transpeptidase YafK
MGFCLGFVNFKQNKPLSMKKYILSILTIIALVSFASTDFLQEQLKFPRVKQANIEKGAVVKSMLTQHGIDPSNFNLFIRGIKDEQKLEVWAKSNTDLEYKNIKTYDFCATTGQLGPKRRSGDKQIPEGFYTVDLFNPYSNHFLSFRVSYPNESDLKFADKLNPGDNIFVHGNCITIGCIPIGNDNIKELYLMAAMAGGINKVNIHLFPTRLNNKGLKNISEGANDDMKTFWRNLQPGFTSFEKNKTLPKVTVNKDGRYVFS